MPQWIKVCTLAEAPAPGQVAEAEVEGVSLCLANSNGELSAIDNHCPHRGGPLSQGWLEGDLVVCPWHSWSFHVRTGVAEFPPGQRVGTYPVKVEDDNLFVDLD